MKVFDLELWLPGSPKPAPGRSTPVGPPGPHRVPPRDGYGFANYDTVFKRWADSQEALPFGEPPNTLEEYAERTELLVGLMDEANVVGGVLGLTAPNEAVLEAAQRHPDRIHGFVHISPFDGMAGVREFERFVTEESAAGLAVFALYEQIPANDRRFYPLYAKCVELDVPVRIYTAMSFATDRPYDLGHPKHLDQIAVDFPELRIVAGLGGWPWVNEMIALVRRHPNLYMDTGSHHPKYFPAPGSGWEMLMQYGNSVLQDKIMVGLSWAAFGVSMDAVVQEYLKLPLKPAVLEKWMYGNAARFFRLDE